MARSVSCFGLVADARRHVLDVARAVAHHLLRELHPPAGEVPHRRFADQFREPLRQHRPRDRDLPREIVDAPVSTGIRVGAAAANAAAAAVALHAALYFTVMVLAAGIVYRKLGLSLLRKAWFNMDWLWAGALLLTGMVVLLK